MWINLGMLSLARCIQDFLFSASVFVSNINEIGWKVFLQFSGYVGRDAGKMLLDSFSFTPDWTNSFS